MRLHLAANAGAIAETVLMPGDPENKPMRKTVNNPLLLW